MLIFSVVFFLAALVPAETIRNAGVKLELCGPHEYLGYESSAFITLLRRFVELYDAPSLSFLNYFPEDFDYRFEQKMIDTLRSRAANEHYQREAILAVIEEMNRRSVPWTHLMWARSYSKYQPYMARMEIRKLRESLVPFGGVLPPTVPLEMFRD